MRISRKKLFNLLLVLTMAFNSFSSISTYALEQNIDSIENSENLEPDENQSDNNVIEESKNEDNQNEDDVIENDKTISEDVELEGDKDNTLSEVEKVYENKTPLPGDSSLVDYFYVESPYVQAPSNQKFILSFGNGTEGITSMVLHYQMDGGFIIDLKGEMKTNGLYLFNKSFNGEEAGTYTVTGFSYFIEDQEYTVSFSDLEMEIHFGVNQTYSGYGQAEGFAVDQNGKEVRDSNSGVSLQTLNELDSSIISVNGTNFDNAEELVESALKNNVSDSSLSNNRARSLEKSYSQSNPLVICIDPGHGGSESGTVVVDGSLEKNMNLKISMYLKEELEQYKNVKVVMTRTSDVDVSLQKRAQIAASAGAVALVSVHINATGWGTQSSISGAEVYYPHANYNSAVSETGKNLAQKILNELTSLGLNNLGIKVKYVYDSVTGKPANDPAYDYPDGSVGDYYGVIRYCKLVGVSGIIVEHAMSDNWSDFNKFLSSDAKLKNLGVADATGIAKAFGLSKVSIEDTDQMAQENKDVLKDGTYIIESAKKPEFLIEAKDGSTAEGTIVQFNHSTKRLNSRRNDCTV